MTKTIISPIKRWPGEVTFVDLPTLPNLVAWSDALIEARQWTRPDPDDAASVLITNLVHYRAALLPGALACVESHTLAGLSPTLTPDNFPGRPRQAVIDLIAWLVEQAAIIFTADDESLDPKGAAE